MKLVMKSLLELRIFCFLFFLSEEERVFAWTSRSTLHPNDPIMMTRRKTFATTVGTALVAAEVLSFMNPSVSVAAAPLDAGEAGRRSAANIPGYGKQDVFYPELFAGNWKMTREVEFNNNNNPSSSSSSSVLRLVYSIRFIRSIEDDAVVADRGYNQAELETALVRTVQRGRKEDGEESSSTTASSTNSPKISYEWVQSNPNDLRLVLSDGTKKEIKVTKRATERTVDTVSSSEFQRVTQEERGGIPLISARRIVSRWKQVDESTLEGIEIVYEMAGGDPLSTSLTGSKNITPTVLSKSRLYLVR
jgi:hypothetical protein